MHEHAQTRTLSPPPPLTIPHGKVCFPMPALVEWVGSCEEQLTQNKACVEPCVLLHSIEKYYLISLR